MLFAALHSLIETTTPNPSAKRLKANLAFSLTTGSAGVLTLPRQPTTREVIKQEEIRKTSGFGRAPPQTSSCPPENQIVKLTSCLSQKLYIFYVTWNNYDSFLTERDDIVPQGLRVGLTASWNGAA